MINLEFFPSRQLALYSVRLYLTRSFAVLVGLVLVLMALDLQGVASSAGSACQSGSIDPSHVLTALRVPHELAIASVRFSLGSLNTDAHVARVAELFPALITKARRLSGLVTG